LSNPRLVVIRTEKKYIPSEKKKTTVGYTFEGRLFEGREFLSLKINRPSVISVLSKSLSIPSHQHTSPFLLLALKI